MAGMEKRMDQKSEMITEKVRFCLNMEEAPGQVGSSRFW
jgi:hypothetical protein